MAIRLNGIFTGDRWEYVRQVTNAEGTGDFLQMLYLCMRAGQDPR